MRMQLQKGVILGTGLTSGATDHELGKLLDALEGEYTVVMFSDPNEFQVYEPEFIESVHKNHVDLRRAVEVPGAIGVRKAANNTERDTRPLFEKYQFFTPGKLILHYACSGSG